VEPELGGKRLWSGELHDVATISSRADTFRRARSITLARLEHRTKTVSAEQP
jgi:hypothetical protein